MSHILLEGVVKSFGPARVLDGCTIAVEKGTVFTLLGPSGCGKTTLLPTSRRTSGRSATCSRTTRCSRT
jgi:ABC-type sugar transport system ATPase subunit